MYAALSLAGLRSNSLSDALEDSTDALPILADALFTFVVNLACFGRSFSYGILLFLRFFGVEFVFSCWSCPLFSPSSTPEMLSERYERRSTKIDSR